MSLPEVVTSETDVLDLKSMVLSYEHPELVERLKKKLGLSESAALELFDDMKKFLYLVGTAHQKLAPTKMIDDGWHEFLMYTRDYASFCIQFFGILLHHTPNPILKPSAVLSPRETVHRAHKVFGTLGNNWRYGNCSVCSSECESDCAADSDCHGDGSCGGDV
mgnify:CR=1 FL=1